MIVEGIARFLACRSWQRGQILSFNWCALYPSSSSSPTCQPILQQAGLPKTCLWQRGQIAFVQFTFIDMSFATPIA